MFREIRSALHATSIVGLVLAASMIVPALADFLVGEPGWTDFLQVAFITFVLWLMVAIATRGRPVTFTPRFGIILVNMLWWLLPLSAIWPLAAGPAKLGFADAVFETVSGFSTTGSTVMTGLDTVDPGTLLWRSMTQWFGGTGILSLGLLILPFLNIGGLQLFRMESSDKSDKVMPRFVEIIRSILTVYLLLTALAALGYALSGMSGFDAVNHAMTTLSTGGYSTHDQSIGYFPNVSTLWVGSVFMALGGLPFTLFVLLVFTRKIPKKDPQIFWYFVIIAGAASLLFLARDSGTAHTARSFAEDIFDVISIITTTGFAAGDYTTWGSLSVPLFFLLTFFGGCSGSTAGGLKIYRLVVLFKIVNSALREMIHPNGVFPVRYGGAHVEPGIFRSAMVMTVAFCGVLGLTTLVLGAQGNDLMTALSGALTALSNVGPGMGETIGPSGNFASLSDTSKYTLCAAMITGRLEVLIVLALLVPALWRD